MARSPRVEKHLAGSNGTAHLPPDPYPESQRGDADETVVDVQLVQPAANGKHEPEKPLVEFPDPIPSSQLKRGEQARWLWHGFLARGAVTMYSALWKAGKTTLLSHLLLALESGDQFCNLDVQPGRVLYITEEQESLWAERRDEMGLHDHVEFLIRPFRLRADWLGWEIFLEHVTKLTNERNYDLVVMDTLSDLWPVRDENDAAQVGKAIKPLHNLPDTLAQLLVHHDRKSDGQQFTAARGSGALHGFVDTIMEFRRYSPSDNEDCRRVITASGRWRETPRELVVELADGRYRVHGSRNDMAGKEIGEEIDSLLPMGPPGLTIDELGEKWPGEHKPRRKRLLDVLRQGIEGGRWHRDGEGRSGSPYRFWVPIP